MHTNQTGNIGTEPGTGDRHRTSRYESDLLAAADDEPICSGDRSRVLAPWTLLAGAMAGVSHKVERDRRIMRPFLFATTLAACLATGAVVAGPAVGDEPPVICDGRVATIVGTPGDDWLRGTDGPDVIAGLQGDDQIFGAEGDDVICGGKGDDEISGGQGFDIIFGAQGNDIIYAADGLFQQRVNTKIVDIKGARMFGGAGNDIIHGSNRWDRMQGGPGMDQLFGYEGRDWMRGGPGADDLQGMFGADDMYGGTGDDWLTIIGADVAARGGPGTDTCFDAHKAVIARSCETNLTTAN